MADDRLPCRDNYTDLETQLQALTAQITAIYQLLADLGLVSLAPISQDDYDSLTPSEQLAGCFDIYDGAEPQIDGHQVSYDSNTDIIQKVDSMITVREATATTGSSLGEHGRTAVNSGITANAHDICFCTIDNVAYVILAPYKNNSNVWCCGIENTTTTVIASGTNVKFTVISFT